jgi:short-subunit dehydrogenase
MKFALITGASKGIGKAIAEELAKKKINLLLVARNEQSLKELSEYLSATYSIQAHYFSIDLTEANAASKVFNWCNQNNFQINILINNAGYGLSGAMEKYSLKEYTDMMQVNMNVPVELSYLFLPQLKQQPSYIMNIASAAAYQSVPGLNVYAATKSFVLSFSRGLRFELRNSDISVTVVSPGGTETGFQERADTNTKKAIKLGKMFNMQPEEVASIAVKAMFAKKSEIITGFVNKLGAFLVWLMPKSISEKSAAGIYME